MKRTLLLFLFAAGAHAADFNVQKLANAIYLAEGGPRARAPYGVLRLAGHSESECRRVCIRTIEHARRDWPGTGSFIDFLADRYCPPSVDPVGNRNWKRNVRLLCK